jgi:molecular chaperone GrpE
MSDLKSDQDTGRDPDESGRSSAEAGGSLPAEQFDTGPDPHALGLELPEDRDEAIALLLAEVARARAEATSYLDDLKRVAADFDNYRKRSMRDQATTHERATERVAEGLLPVLDTFDAALGTEANTDAEKQLYSGMINTREQLLSSLRTAGLEVIPTIGESFDPEIHEPAGAPTGSGQLIVEQELRRGYRLNGKVLRAALVVLEVKE